MTEQEVDEMSEASHAFEVALAVPCLNLLSKLQQVQAALKLV